MQEIEFHRALARPGVIVDAGAHEGAMAVALAALPNVHVLAFEPLPSAFARLRAGGRGGAGADHGTPPRLCPTGPARV